MRFCGIRDRAHDPLPPPTCQSYSIRLIQNKMRPLLVAIDSSDGSWPVRMPHRAGIYLHTYLPTHLSTSPKYSLRASLVQKSPTVHVLSSRGGKVGASGPPRCNLVAWFMESGTVRSVLKISEVQSKITLPIYAKFQRHFQRNRGSACEIVGIYK
jgi:hypothetical protein